MESKESRSGNDVLNWEGPRLVVIPRAEFGFGFTLRHFVVYPPQQLVEDPSDEALLDFQGSNRPSLYRASSIEPQDTIFVKSVKEASPAHYAGLKTGDWIIAINGDSISGKSYPEVIALIHQSTPLIKLLVVPKDEDILQMAYQSHDREAKYSSSNSLSKQSTKVPDVRAQHYHSHSSSDIVHGSKTFLPGVNYSSSDVGQRHDIRHSYPLSQWDAPSSGSRFGSSLDELHNTGSPQAYRAEPLASSSRQNLQSKSYRQQQRSAYVDPDTTMSSNIYNVPTKAKYSFGLYFPPKSANSNGGGSSSSSNSSHTISAESLGRQFDDPHEPSSMSKSLMLEMNSQRPGGSGYRKTSLDESSALSSSAKSRDYFIRYSSDKAANDMRNKYSPRHSVYKSQPTYIISRSQTVSAISPSKVSTGGSHSSSARPGSDYLKSGRRGSEEVAYTSEFSRSRHYVPVLAENKRCSSSDSIDKHKVVGACSRNTRFVDQPENSSGSRTFVVRIPYEKQQQYTQHDTSHTGESNYIPVRQNYGTTFALTRSPTATHIEIQKSIGKPIVSQRKNQFESGRNENTPPPGNGGLNRYKTEIEKIRTQPRFSSIAMRRASFEQSPEKDPPGYDDPVESREESTSAYTQCSVDTAQPTVKVCKISSERYGRGSPHQQSEGEQAPIRIYVSSGTNSTPSSPIVEIVPMFPGDGNQRHILGDTSKSGTRRSGGYYYSSPTSSASTSTISGVSDGQCAGALVDSGVWIKSHHGSSDMLDSDGADGNLLSGVMDSGVFSVDGTAIVSGHSDSEIAGARLSRPARKTSYLSAVNAPHSKGTEPKVTEGCAGYPMTPQEAMARSQALPYPISGASSIQQPSSLSSSPGSHFRPLSHPSSMQPPTDAQSHSSFPSSGSSHSLSSLSSGNAPVAPTVPPVMSASDSLMTMGHPDMAHHLQGSHVSIYAPGNAGVTMRKKLPESQEDQANKLHRRTSYLMATARDRTNTVPIEQAFSTPQVISDHRPGKAGGSVRHQSSIKLNKFFGEMIPSIAEDAEMKSANVEEPPEVIRKGTLTCKISVIEGKKCSDRSWKQVFAVLRQNELILTRDKEHISTSSSSDDHHIPLKSCMVESARDYAKKKKNVFRLTSHQECEYLFQTEDKGTMLCWIQAIKSINEPEKAEKMDQMIANEQAKHTPAPVEINVIPSSKMSPQLGGLKGKKLSALSLKAKLSTSPSMRRKKSNASEKGEDNFKKSWKGRIPMMKSSKKHSMDSSVVLLEPDIDTENFQFGAPLEECFPSPHNEYVPLIVELCTSIVEARGLEVVGVYRVPGNSAAVNALTDEFNRGIDNVNINNEKLLDINVISSLLKSFFHKLPEPLVPSDSYYAFIDANRFPDEDKRKLKLKRLLQILPPHHLETFKHMAQHLNKVATYGKINRMGAKNLALMFGPTLVRKKDNDAVSLVTDMSDQCRIVESIILHHEWFFSAWNNDSYIPMETSVTMITVDESQGVKDDDEEADSAINTKEIISSIVNAASKKLRSRQDKTLGALDMVDSTSSTASISTGYTDRNMDEAMFISNIAKSVSSIASSRSASEEFLDCKSSPQISKSADKRAAAPIANSEPDFLDLEFADASSPLSSNLSPQYSDESILDKNDELEISHALPTSLSRDAIHNTLKRIGNDVSVLLQTFEQKQLKEREKRRREQELIEQEHQRTRLELEQEESHSVEDWLACQGAVVPSRMPDLVSSSYIGETFPYDQNRDRVGLNQADSERGENSSDLSGERKVVTKNKYSSSAMAHSMQPLPALSQAKGTTTLSKVDVKITPSACEPVRNTAVPVGPSQRRIREHQQKNFHLGVGIEKQGYRPSTLRHSIGRRHGSLDSLIDLLDKQDKRSSWASSDSEDGSDLLTSITATFDQKLQILLNPKYKLTGGGRKNLKNEPSIQKMEGTTEVFDRNKTRHCPGGSSLHGYTAAALVDPDGSFRDPSLHRSAKSDPKMEFVSRSDRSKDNRAASLSPVTVQKILLECQAGGGQQRKNQLPDFRAFFGKSGSVSKETNPLVLTQPKKLENGKSGNKTGKAEARSISKMEKTERNSNLARLSREENSMLGFKDCDEEERSGNKEHCSQRKREGRQGHRRHTVGGIEDLDHVNALSLVCRSHNIAGVLEGGDTRESRLSAWEQLQPVVKDPGAPGDRNLQAWIQRERLRGSTPDLSCQD